MSRTRKYRPPYQRRPDPGLVAADSLYAQAKAANGYSLNTHPIECPTCGAENTTRWCTECSTELTP